jgi:hypothetical protein
MNRWKQHFQDLVGGSEMDANCMRKETEQETNEVEEMLNENEYLTIEDIKEAIEKLKNNRSPGPDNIIAELFRTEQNALEITLHKVICQVRKDEVIPEQWEEGFICPIYKKGDQLHTYNNRGITLLNTGYKIFSNILYERLQPYVEKIVGNYQCAFQAGKSNNRSDKVNETDFGKNTGIWNQHISSFHRFQSHL